MIGSIRRLGHSVLMSGLFVALLLSATTLYAKGKPEVKAKPYNNEYSMVVQALRGPENTEVTVTLSTSNPVVFPIPNVLKKLQVKIKDGTNQVAFIVNENDVAVTNGRVVRLVPNPGRHETLRILAIIDAGQSVVLNETVRVLFRPDLTVLFVTAPSQVNVGQAINIDVNIRETKQDLGAIANVSLYVGGNLSSSVTGVQVQAGGVTTVVYAGVSFTDPGTKDLNAPLCLY